MSATTFHLVLYRYRGSSGDTITVDDYLALDAKARSTVAADLDRVTIA
jgi:hypothetical protein